MGDSTDHSRGVPLKEHIESRIAALERATLVAAAAMEKRLDTVNELEAQARLMATKEELKAQARFMATRQDLNIELAAIKSDLREVRDNQILLRGKASQTSVIIAYIISVMGLLLSASSLLLSFLK